MVSDMFLVPKFPSGIGYLLVVKPLLVPLLYATESLYNSNLLLVFVQSHGSLIVIPLEPNCCPFLCVPCVLLVWWISFLFVHHTPLVLLFANLVFYLH